MLAFEVRSANVDHLHQFHARYCQILYHFVNLLTYVWVSRAFYPGSNQLSRSHVSLSLVWIAALVIQSTSVILSLLMHLLPPRESL